MGAITWASTLTRLANDIGIWLTPKSFAKIPCRQTNGYQKKEIATDD